MARSSFGPFLESIISTHISSDQLQWKILKIVIVNFVFIAGLSKIGVEVAFINYNMRSKSLLHCFNVSGAKFLIVGKGK